MKSSMTTVKNGQGNCLRIAMPDTHGPRHLSSGTTVDRYSTDQKAAAVVRLKGQTTICCHDYHEWVIAPHIFHGC